MQNAVFFSYPNKAERLFVIWFVYYYYWSNAWRCTSDFLRF